MNDRRWPWWAQAMVGAVVGALLVPLGKGVAFVLAKVGVPPVLGTVLLGLVMIPGCGVNSIIRGGSPGAMTAALVVTNAAIFSLVWVGWRSSARRAEWARVGAVLLWLGLILAVVIDIGQNGL